MSTFLELCQRTAREIHIPGSGPTSISSTISEEEKIIRQVANADMDIQRDYIDWKFLWDDDYSHTLAQSEKVVLTTSNPAILGTWDVDSFYIDRGLSTYRLLKYVEWHTFRDTYHLNDVTLQEDKPEFITIRPDKRLQLYPIPDQAYTLTGEYWKRADEMTDNNQVSIIPVEFHRLIVVRAKITWGEMNDAPDILMGASAEHDHLLDQMIAHYGPDQQVKRKLRSTSSERIVVSADAPESWS